VRTFAARLKSGILSDFGNSEKVLQIQAAAKKEWAEEMRSRSSYEYAGGKGAAGLHAQGTLASYFRTGSRDENKPRSLPMSCPQHRT
jgi:hypothetical protein